MSQTEGAMRSGALPVYQQILLDVLFPPVGAYLWSVMARGWAGLIRKGTITVKTSLRQKREFWIILVAGYLIMFGITIYALVT